VELVALSMASSWLPAGVPLLLAIDGGECGLGREDEKKRKKKMTYGARMPVVGERGYNEIYVVVYTCNWIQVVSIRILWYFCGKRRIVIVHFKIDE
jgi:hypothetical protein